MKKYSELMTEIEQGVNAVPMMFAFSNEQFKEGKEKFGVKDNSELLSIGAGGFIKKTDRELFRNTFKSTGKKLEEYLKIDEQLKDAFLYELGNHEFCITYDYEQTLDSLGLKLEKLTKKQTKILIEAKDEYLELCRINDWG